MVFIALTRQSEDLSCILWIWHLPVTVKLADKIRQLLQPMTRSDAVL